MNTSVLAMVLVTLGSPAYSGPASAQTISDSMTTPIRLPELNAPCEPHLSPDLSCQTSSCRKPWYGRFSTLTMTRDTENAEWFSYYTDNEAAQLMDSRDLVSWGSGFETAIGYCFCRLATEVSYWGLFTDTEEANLYDAAGAVSLNTTFNISGSVQYNPGGGNQPITNFLDGAERHRLRREYELHNIEWNLLSGGGSRCGGCLPCGWGGHLEPLVGLRFVRLNDQFEFHSDPVNRVFSGDPNEVVYAIETENHLIGCQLGGRAEYWMGNRFRLNVGAKFGAFVNIIDHRSFLGGSNGAAVITGGPNTGMTWDVRSDSTDLAFLGELDFGLTYQLTSHCAATLGYRVMALSNVALSTNQIPRDFRGIQDVNAIDTNANLILYGGYAGLEFTY